GYPTGAAGFVDDAERLRFKRLERKGSSGAPGGTSMGGQSILQPNGEPLEEIIRLYKWSEPFEDNQFWICFVQGGEHYFYTPFYHDLRIEYEDGSYEQGDSNTQRFRDWWNVSGAYANEDDDREQDGGDEEEEYYDSVHRDGDGRRSGD